MRSGDRGAHTQARPNERAARRRQPRAGSEASVDDGAPQRTFDGRRPCPARPDGHRTSTKWPAFVASDWSRTPDHFFVRYTACGRAPYWVRLGVAVTLAFATPHRAVAVTAPDNWFRFPGRPAGIAAEPPYNHHLVNDASAGFLAAASCCSWPRSETGRRCSLAGHFICVHGAACAVPLLTNPADTLTGVEKT